MIGRYSEIHGINEVSDLKAGMDFRLPEYRREVFLRFYEFHIKYKAHAGAIYYMIPFLKERFNLTKEQILWLCFINGVSQNIITTWLIFQEFSDLKTTNIVQLQKYFRENYERFGWDTDRRYVKNKFESIISSYKNKMIDTNQENYFGNHLRGGCYENFNSLWNHVMNEFDYFGRLATFSYLEYLKIAGLNIDCDSLFLDNIEGSKSHRNGLCIVLGRDEMDWKKDTKVHYDDNFLKWLDNESKVLLNEARQRIDDKDVSFFTLETTLCCYKSWHRLNRRYPNCYNDMFYERIKYAENQWNGKKDFSIFWEARKLYLPQNLRKEDNPMDCGLKPQKQNHYLNTGEVIMMDNDFDCFKIKDKRWEYKGILLIGNQTNPALSELLTCQAENTKTIFIGNIKILDCDNFLIIRNLHHKPTFGELSIILKTSREENKFCIFEDNKYLQEGISQILNFSVLQIGYYYGKVKADYKFNSISDLTNYISNIHNKTAILL